ncbi:acyltransferase [Aetokthonos hydrillicola Thurmond2011]|jgi:surface polysaccharide O-acyltransferase-like enzyme|uniref:Acyltransferase n=1 Tax=Aetokthonos hydrillicola Thurmond2011 TaxID=2712845 RepID=A0AAP5I1U9_9CYAN|nr:acyltransferase [Aetokthonos hydrillicola]MBO3460919.1 acyltransferase [Aetokthonos hydrillicola CCALA 1050]MBW4586468.1 acyltransferase [Aetokthonos hydrillicola CCALA 1050]MDR9893587.1 acyltransferase [Aetokthonos hydrillicola Thurmond2011]
MKIHSTRGVHKQRLIGIDLFRGIAAYAVCIIHADAVMTFSGFSVDDWMTGLTQMSRFAVPFFLAASFYLMTNKLYKIDSHFSFFANFKSRFIRLFIPYLCWSIIYMLLRLIEALGTHKGLANLFQDPVLVILLGGSAFHLYFLPLLFSGSFLLIFAQYLAKRNIKIISLISLFILSIIIYEIMIVSGNGFQLGTYCLEEKASSCSVAFQGFIQSALPNFRNNQLVRLVFVEISWLVQCLPYVFMGMILNYPSIKEYILKINKRKTLIFLVTAILFSVFGVLNRFDILYFPVSLYEVGTSVFLLIYSILCSSNMGKYHFIENLGISSFGIYLMHYLTLKPYANIAAKLPTEFTILSPASTMLLLATLCFLTSWLITSLFLNNKLFSRLLFGL